MSYLLDTNIIITWLENELREYPSVRKVIRNPENTVFLSSVVIWEIAIKRKLGKLTLPSNYYDILHDEHFTPLHITHSHARLVESLPLHHADPFDRLLIAQAQSEHLTIITMDKRFTQYNVMIFPSTS